MSSGQRLARWPAPLFMLYANAATFLCSHFWGTSLTPLPLSVCNLQSPSAADINIDIETVEKLIGEIIAQPLG